MNEEKEKINQVIEFLTKKRDECLRISSICGGYNLKKYSDSYEYLGIAISSLKEQIK